MTVRNRAIFVSVTCLGMSSLMTQIVTLREFLNVLAGNELVIGLILANWLLLTGFGSYLGRIVDRLLHPVHWLVGLQVAVALLPFVQISAIRLLKRFMVPGLMLGLHEAFLYSFLLLLPYCTVSGFMLTLFASLGGEHKDALQIGDIYVLDVIGDIIGGLLFSFLLVYFLSPFQILTFLLVINLAAALLVSTSTLSRKVVIPLGACCVMVLALLALADLEKTTGRALFHGQEVLLLETTPYGNLAVTRSGNQFTVYENSIPVGSSENTIVAEESTHFGLSQHNAPENILLVSGGLNGALEEILKYPVKKVDYVELDPDIIRLVRRLAPGAGDNRVILIAEDGRRYIRTKTAHYDAILIDLADPATAQLNRFYSQEFFQEARRALRPGGVLSFSLGGAENYANPEMRLLSSTVYRALQEVFANILIIPGSRQYYIAGNGSLDYRIARKISRKNISTRYVNEEYLQARLTADRIALAKETVSVPSSANRDFRPASYYGLLHYWLSKFQSSLLLPILFACTIALFIILFIAQTPRIGPPIALSVSGFSGMGLEIIILLAFQVTYGFVYQQLGLIITAFLFGTALGGYWSVRSRTAAGNLFFRIDISLSLFAFFLVPVLIYLQSSTSVVLQAAAPILLFPCLTAGIGFLVGAQFPAAARLTFHGLEKTASTLYAVDFLGAALGALLVTTFAVPLLGIIGTCYLIGTLKALSSLVLWLSRAEKAEVALTIRRSETAPQLAFLVILLVFCGIGFLVYTNNTSTILYAMSFYPPYHWLLLGLLGLAVLQAMQLTPSYLPWRKLDQEIYQRTRVGAARWLYFISFSLLIFFPIFRCYFKIPYLFCHVCPRQCGFGYLRPYLVPAALIMNIEKRYWCFHFCPIGTFFDCQARVSPKPMRQPKTFKIIPLAVLLFTVIAYFKMSADMAKPGTATGDWYIFFFKNIYTPTGMVILAAVLLIVLAFKLRRSFCELLCPVGTLSDLILRSERLLSNDKVLPKTE